MDRKPTWKQDTPREQLVMLLQSVQGHLLNLKDGHTKKTGKEIAERCLPDLEDCQKILYELIHEGSWDNPVCSQCGDPNINLKGQTKCAKCLGN